MKLEIEAIKKDKQEEPLKNKFIHIKVEPEDKLTSRHDAQDSQRDKLLTGRSAVQENNYMFSVISQRDPFNLTETARDMKNVAQTSPQKNKANPKEVSSWNEDVSMSLTKRDSPTNRKKYDESRFKFASSKKNNTQEVVEDEEHFYESYQEIFEGLEVPEKIVKYKKDSQKKQCKNIIKLMLISLILVSFSIASFGLTLYDSVVFRNSSTVLKSLCSIKILVGYIFSSTIYSATQLKDTYIYKGNRVSARFEHLGQTKR